MNLQLDFMRFVASCYGVSTLERLNAFSSQLQSIITTY
jgi:hypothetical protein